MNNQFLNTVRYTKMNNDGTYKRVNENFLFFAHTFSDSEARVYEELGSQIKGEFNVTAIKRVDYVDIFPSASGNFEAWYEVVAQYETTSDDGDKAKKVKNKFLIASDSVKNATEEIKEELNKWLMDFKILSTKETNIMDVFYFKPTTEEVVEKFHKSMEDLGVTVEITNN